MFCPQLGSCVKYLACLFFSYPLPCSAKAKFNNAIMYDITAQECTGMAGGSRVDTCWHTRQVLQITLGLSLSDGKQMSETPL